MSLFASGKFSHAFASRLLAQALISLCCACTAISALAATPEVGAIPGSFAVSATGAATYSIPIQLPPGMPKLTPHLALTYSSQSGNALAGYGWNLSGLSAITVCPKTLVQDGVNQGMSFAGQSSSANDFCLDGSKLLMTYGSYGGNGSEYRKEVDDFTKVFAYTTGGSGPAVTSGPQYFVVRPGNGLVYMYGVSSDSEILASGPDVPSGVAVVRTWALSSITDAYGNSVDFTYAQDTANGDFWPTSITYTGNHDTSLTGPHQITFSYDTLSSINPGLVRGSYLAGASINQTKRLKEIDVNYNGVNTFKYTLTYQTTLTDSAGNPGTERSLLHTVSECAGTTCYPTTTINWQTGTSGWSNSPQSAGWVMPDAAHAAAMQLIDVNGDGRADLVYPGSTYWMIMFGTASGFSAPYQTSAYANIGYLSAVPIDLKGDGHTGLLVTDGSGAWSVLMPTPTTDPNSAGGYTLQSKKLGDNTSSHNPLPATGAWGNVTIADVNGDGLPDILFSDGTTLQWYQNVGGGYFAPASAVDQGAFSNTQDDIMQRQFTVSTPDFDGDGKSDYVSLKLFNTGCDTCNGPYIATWGFHIGGPTPTLLGAIRGSTGNYNPPFFVDFNGDGLTDALYADGASGGSWTWTPYESDGVGLVTGTGAPWSASVMSDPITVDYAGNGRQEVMGPMGNCPSDAGLVGYFGGGFNGPIDSGLSAPQCASGYAAGSLRAGDITGDGLQDLVWVANNTVYYVTHNGVYPDLVNSITDGFGQNYTITYASLSDGATYTKGSSAVFPVRDFDGPLYVVDHYTGNDGIGGLYTDTYSYSGAQVNIQGRGFLGFGEVDVTDSRSSAPKAETDTTYQQAFPYIGAIHTVTQKVGSSLSDPVADDTVHLVKNVYPSSTTPTLGGAVYPMPPTTTVADCELGSSCTFSTGYSRESVTAPVTDTSLAHYTLISGGVMQEYVATTTTNPGNFVATTDTTYDTSSASLSHWCVALQAGLTVTRSAGGDAGSSRTIGYTDDDSHCLRQTESITDSVSNQTLKTTYTYDPTYGTLTTVAVEGDDPNNNISTTRTTSLGYDSTNSFISTITRDPTGLDIVTAIQWDPSLGVRQSITDPNGIKTTFSYDPFGLMATQSNPDGTSIGLAYTLCSASDCGTGNPGITQGKYTVTTTHYSSNNAAGAESTTVYDSFGRMLLRSSYLLNNQLDYIQTAYDSLGRVVAVSLPYTGSAAAAWSYSDYDSLNRLVDTYAPAGQNSGCGVSYQGEVTCQTHYTYNGLATSVTDANGKITGRSVDAIGELTSTTDANNGSTTYQYDDFGDLTQTTDVANHVTQMEYDSWGRKIDIKNDPSMGTWSCTYTPFGELYTRRDAKGQVTSRTYDVLGRLKTRQKPVAGGGTGTDTWTYDGPNGQPAAPYIGKLYQLQGADGYARGYQYDHIGRPDEVDTTIGATTYATSTAYDSFGRIASVTYPSTPAPVADAAPVANAGASQQVNFGQSVTLSGTQSYDPDNGPQPLSYHWTQVDGPVSTSADGSTSSQPSFTPTVAGIYDFMLTVSDGELTASATTSVTVVPLVPTGLGATAPVPSTGNFNLTWTGAAGDQLYQLEEAVGSGSYTTLPGNYTSPTPLSRGDGTYYYAVNGCSNNTGSNVCSPWSAPITVTVLRTPGVPTKPGISPSPSTTGSFTVSWSKPAGTITYYKIYASTNGTSYDSGTDVGNVLSKPYTVSSNGTYWYKVAACNTVNGSEDCSAASTANSVAVTLPVPQAPTLSANPSSLPQAGGSSTLSWSPVGSPTPTSYNLQQSASSGFGTPNTIYSGGLKTYTVNLKITKYYRVQGCVSAGCGPWSSVVTVTVSSGSGGLAPIQGTAAPAPASNSGPIGMAAPVASPVLQPLAPQALSDLGADMLVAVKPAAANAHQMLMHLREAAVRAEAIRQPHRRIAAVTEDRLFDPRGAGGVTVSYAALQMESSGLGNALTGRLVTQAAQPRAVPATVSLTRYQVNYVYDSHENLTQVVDAANPNLIYWQAQSTNNLGEITSEILGNGVITTRAFDPNTGALVTEQSGVGNQMNLENKAYAWDAVGNLSSRIDGVHGTTETFQYDNLYRLTQAKLTGGSANVAPLNVTYDALGNISTKTQPGTAADVGTYTYDPNHPFQIAQITPSSGPVRSFQYDNSNGAAGNGNLVSDGVNTYTAWDSDNHPTQITNATTGTTTNFTYAPDGMRYQETTTQGGISNTLTEVNRLFQITSDGTTTWYQEMISAGGQPVAVRTLRQDGQLFTRYMIRDHLGSSSVLTDESGNLKCETAYDAFGNQRDPVTGGTPTNPSCNSLPQTSGGGEGNGRGYTGQQQLDGLNLIHMNGRVYDPVIGRMISADPTVPDPLYSQAFNRYAYVYNNPMNTTDPSGFGGPYTGTETINVAGFSIDLPIPSSALSNMGPSMGNGNYNPLGLPCPGCGTLPPWLAPPPAVIPTPTLSQMPAVPNTTSGSVQDPTPPQNNNNDTQNNGDGKTGTSGSTGSSSSQGTGSNPNASCYANRTCNADGSACTVVNPCSGGPTQSCSNTLGNDCTSAGSITINGGMGDGGGPLENHCFDICGPGIVDPDRSGVLSGDGMANRYHPTDGAQHQRGAGPASPSRGIGQLLSEVTATISGDIATGLSTAEQYGYYVAKSNPDSVALAGKLGHWGNVFGAGAVVFSGLAFADALGNGDNFGAALDFSDAGVGAVALYVGGLPGLIGGGAYTLMRATGLGDAIGSWLTDGDYGASQYVGPLKGEGGGP